MSSTTPFRTSSRAGPGCWVPKCSGCPGTDHAGIATQNVVERQLRKEGKTRHDLGREEFLKLVWEWKAKHGGIIIRQLKRLGCSCDWSRERFTMDAGYSSAVTAAFVELYKKGLIYRGNRMVHWDPVARTALSDEEVIMRPEKGILYYFKVAIAEQPGQFLTIATTRPETIPGDTAIAVNPNDERYARLIGMHAIRPLPDELPAGEKLIPIIGDSHVEFEFGTGALKVTPAHDKADFEIGARHSPADSRYHEPRRGDERPGRPGPRRPGPIRGARSGRSQARGTGRHGQRGYLRAQRRLLRADQCPRRAASERPMVSPVPGHSPIRRAVRSGAVAFRPERWAAVYGHWMGNIQDWCISRQLWWGHRIPVWYSKTNPSDPPYVGIDAAR